MTFGATAAAPSRRWQEQPKSQPLTNSAEKTAAEKRPEEVR